MKIDFSGKVALVTAASQGIGAGAAVVLARNGAAVAVDYIGPDEYAEEVCQRTKATGQRVFPIKADVTDSDAVKRTAPR